jgi:hypothetical protein
MAGYGGTGKAVLLRANQQQYLFQQETNVTGRASMAVQLERISHSFYPWGMSVQVFFTDVNGNPADPGTFELDIQASDIDQENKFCTISTITQTAQNPSFAAVYSTTTNYMKFARVFVKTLTNPVFTSVLATR